ncbi:MAG: hypothetical protein LRY41_01785 [Candidatus Pacebacteria bacterium]|nr:hypothetical protein [Candidatus Paceibacterota bacterium]
MHIFITLLIGGGLITGAYLLGKNTPQERNTLTETEPGTFTFDDFVLSEEILDDMPPSATPQTNTTSSSAPSGVPISGGGPASALGCAVNAPGNVTNAQAVQLWNNLSSQSLYDQALASGIWLEEGFGVNLSGVKDVTGDGVSEAIFTGNGGNADVSFIARALTPTTYEILRMKLENNTSETLSLMRKGVVTYSVGYRIKEDQCRIGIYQYAIDQIAGNINCSSQDLPAQINGYIWNQNEGLFVWNTDYTQQLIQEICT